jgi:Tfp pilus assembly protein PilN
MPEFPGVVTVQTGPPDELAPVIAVVTLLVVATILLLPLIRAWARRIERGGADAELRGEVEELRARLAEVEQHQLRLADLEERLDFAERLLAQQRAPDRIGPS